MISWLLPCVAVASFWMGRLPYKVRARRWKKLREQYLHDSFHAALSRVHDLSWRYVKDNAPFVYTYFRRGDHRMPLDRRLRVWWQQTAPRYSNTVKEM